MAKTFETSYLRETLKLPDNSISSVRVAPKNSPVTYDVIFQDLDGSFWKTMYLEGTAATGDRMSWDIDSTVEAVQVKRAETVISWVPIAEIAAKEDIA